MIWGWLIPGWLRKGALALGAFALAMLAAFGAGKREAKREAKAKAAKRKVETIETVRDLEDDARKTSDADLADRLSRGR